ncbi:MAG TPA: universal stress protein UspA [Clostridiaceae bacterium]|nr:universal stress protein UspA [Clostridiaceae bacterium]
MPNNILVCVTQQKTCEKLIRKAAELRDQSLNSPYEIQLFVLHVAKNDWNFLDNAKEGEALDYLFNISKSVGAELTVLKSDEIAKSISDFAIENNVGRIIMGTSPGDHQENKFYNRLKALLGNSVDIQIVP